MDGVLMRLIIDVPYPQTISNCNEAMIFS
jgi:hypothetical protein